MNLVCTLFGHRPVPLMSWRRRGRWENRCLLCHQPLVRHGRQWQPNGEEDRGGDAPASPH